jgi:hypothetical protein
MKTALTIICIVLMSLSARTQDVPFPKNDIYLEAGGWGGFGSINYERQLTKNPGIGIRLGLGFYTENAFYATIPVGLVYLFETKKPGTFWEAGMGMTWMREDGKFFDNEFMGVDIYDKYTNVNMSVGFRKHTARNVMWRAQVGGLFNKYTVLPWAGIAVGKRF